jgi:hypothetical protein
MSSNLYLEICNDDPLQIDSLSKIGDFLSTKDIGEKLHSNVFRALRAQWSDVINGLSNFQKAGFVKLHSLATCANEECKEILDETFYCEFCEHSYLREDVEEENYYELIKKVPRSADKFWRRRTGMAQEFKTENNETRLGVKDDDFIYVEEAFADASLKVMHNDDVFHVLEPTFLPEYGNQPRAYAYKYTRIRMEKTVMQNNNNFQNNQGYINIGQIKQTNHQIASENVSTLLKEIRSAAVLDTDLNGKLIDLLDKSLNDKSQQSWVTTLNKMVGLAADYSAVLGPFLPRILAALGN